MAVEYGVVKIPFGLLASIHFATFLFAFLLLQRNAGFSLRINNGWEKEVPLNPSIVVRMGLGAKWLPAHSFAVYSAQSPLEGLAQTPVRNREAKALNLDHRLLARNGLALGSPGSGKTQLLVLLAQSAQQRGESVWVIDPKGSQSFYHQIRAGARKANKPFFALLPQRAQESIQYDPLKHCHSGLDVATRIVSLMPGDQHDVFKHFCWGVVVTLTEALFVIHQRPTLHTLRELLPEAGEALLPRLMQQTNRQAQSNVSNTLSALKALVHHDRIHYKKMIVPLRAVFELLCSGSVGQIVSDEFNQSPSFLSGQKSLWLDVAAARDQRATVYIGLDALINPTVARALAALILQDIASDAAQRVTASNTEIPQLLLVDEAGEVACEPLLQLLGKGRECGVQTWFAVQTLSDLEWRLGGAAAARVAEGNAGAWFLFRQLDAVSRRESERRLGTLPVARRSASLGTSSMMRQGSRYESDSVSDGYTRETVPRIPEAVFSCLDDLECFAHLPDGSLFHLKLQPADQGEPD